MTGYGAITALGHEEEAWPRILAGERGIGPIRCLDVSGCRVTIAAEVDEATLGTRGTRTQRLACYAVRRAIAAAGLGPVQRARTALVLGSAGGGDAALEQAVARTDRSGFSATAALRLSRYPKRAITDYVARQIGIGGPRATVNTACSSGVVAIIHAAEQLQAGWCDVALAGAADELTRFTLTGFCSLRAVDPRPCRPFDRDRQGMSLGEGAGCLVLERLDDARRRGARIAAVLRGWGHTCDAGHLTAPDPTGRGAARAISQALSMAGIGPNDVGFVNAHGTGTLHNDRAELAALALACGERVRGLPVHSLKAAIGHCMGAAGVIEAIVTIQTLTRLLVPPTAGLECPESPQAAAFVLREPRAIRALFGLSNNLGFGGNNGALVLERGEGK